jgi:hypothetical protein
LSLLSLGGDGIQRLYALSIGLLLFADVLAISASLYLLFNTTNKFSMDGGGLAVIRLTGGSFRV